MISGSEREHLATVSSDDTFGNAPDVTLQPVGLRLIAEQDAASVAVTP